MNTKKSKISSKPRNFVAKDLFSAKYRMKVEKSSAIFYSRAVEKQKNRNFYDGI
jgi:hypothetical protein